MRLRIRHETVYEYAEPAFDSQNYVRLQPLDDELQRRLSFKLETDPTASPREHEDYFGNTVHYLNIAGYHRRLVIRAESVVVTFASMAKLLPRDRPLPLAALAKPSV